MTVNTRKHALLWVMTLVLLALISGPHSSWAGTLKLRLDKDHIQPGEATTLSIRLPSGADEDPRLPRLPDWVDVQPAGRRSVTNIINFKVESYTEFTWILVPSRPGTLQIGPVTARIGGEIWQSEPQVVVVTPSSSDERTSRDAFVEVEVDPPLAWPGQQVTYKVRFFYDAQVTDLQYDPPSFEGFVEEPTPDALKHQSLKDVDGRTYVVEELTHVLFPTRPGQLKIDGAGFVVEMVAGRQRQSNPADPFGFFNNMNVRTTRRKFYGESLTVEVKPFPPRAPDNFAGVVGNFTLRASLSASTVARGEPTTLTVVVEGIGNVRDIPTPTFKDPQFKIYPDQPVTEVAIDPDTAQLRGRRVFKMALIPQVEGNLTLAPFTLARLEPDSGVYLTSESPVLTLVVTPGAGAAPAPLVAPPSAAPSNRQVTSLGTDILPLKQVHPPLMAALSPTDPEALGLLLSPPFLFVVTALTLRGRERRAHNAPLERQKKALGRALKSLDQLSTADNLRERLRSLGRIIHNYLSDRLLVEANTLTPPEVRGLLTDKQVEGALIQELVHLLDELDGAQFRPSAGAHSTDHLVTLTRDVLRRLDGGLP